MAGKRKNTIKQWIKTGMYSFVKVCPPARKVVRNLLFRYRGRIYRRGLPGVGALPHLMGLWVLPGRGRSDSPPLPPHSFF